MKFNELPIGEPCGLKGGRHVFCRFSPENDLNFDHMVFVMGTGGIAHVSEFGGETCMEREDFGIVNPYGEIEVYPTFTPAIRSNHRESSGLTSTDAESRISLNP